MATHWPIARIDSSAETYECEPVLYMWTVNRGHDDEDDGADPPVSAAEPNPAASAGGPAPKPAGKPKATALMLEHRPLWARRKVTNRRLWELEEVSPPGEALGVPQERRNMTNQMMSRRRRRDRHSNVGGVDRKRKRALTNQKEGLGDRRK